MKASKDVSVAVASRSVSRHPILRAELSQKFVSVKFNETDRTLTGHELVEFLASANAAIIGLEVITEPILAQLPRLKVIGKYGVGLDKLDLQALAARGVQVGWQAGVNKRAVAELALCLMLGSLRRVTELGLRLKDGRWETKPGRQLSGRRVGLVGCGNVGQEVVSLLAPLGCQLHAFDIRDKSDFYRANGVTSCSSLDELLQVSEVVSLHVPLNASTRMMLGQRELALMPQGSVLVNTARGGIVDEGALREALEKSHLAAAAFDVFAEEPPTDRELIGMPTFFATPHIGGGSEEAILAMGRAAIAGLEAPVNPLNLLEFL